MKNPRNLLAQSRKHSGLSSFELAAFLGLGTSALSLIERGRRRPRFETMVMLEVLFGKSAGTLFPEVYEHLEERVMHVAKRMEEKLRDRTDETSRMKLAFLHEMASRAPSRTDA